MSLLLTPEQEALQDALLAALDPSTRDHHPGVEWKLLSDELGVAGLMVPETSAGAGGTFADLAVVMEELGYALASAPFLSHAVLATYAVVLAATDHPRLAELATGAQRAAFIGHDESQRRALVAADGHDGEVVLSGTARGVIDGAGADLYIVCSEGPDGHDFYLVEPSDAQVSTTQLVSLDLDRSHAEVSLAQAPGERLLTGVEGTEVLRAVTRAASFALAAEQVGGARRCLADATEYAKVRYQFGRPIGSFQAIKHRLADMYLQVRSGHAALRQLANVLDSGSSDADELGSIAAVYCAESYVRCARDSLQIHGGLGFTTELDCHRHLRRALASERLLNTPAQHRERLAARVLAPA